MLKISVIIPTYMQAVFIEECLQSVLEQSYFNKEVLVFDGGSSDGTVEILKKYDKQLDYWESIRDKGQTDAINKGLERMTGDVWCYLNSDDLLEEGALSQVAEAFEEPTVNWLVGQTLVFDKDSTHGIREPSLPQSNRDYLPYWGKDRGRISFSCSCAHFFRWKVVDRVGYMREDLHYTMDMEYYARLGMVGQYQPNPISQVLARWRFHDNSKTVQNGIAYGFIEEELKWAKEYEDYLADAGQAAFLREWQREYSYLPLRKAEFFLNQRAWTKACKHWLHAPFVAPVVLFRRWWWSLGKSLFSLWLAGR